MARQLDLRIQKTRSALTTSLYNLLLEKSFDDITVTELCEKAVIRKATFYKHFGDKTELLVYMIREMQRISEEENKIGYDLSEPYSYYFGVFKYLVNFMDSNEQFVLSILKSNSSSVIRNILEEEIYLGIDRRLRQESRKDVKNSHAMLAAIYSASIVSCGIWWITQKERISKEVLFQQFNEFLIKL